MAARRGRWGFPSGRSLPSAASSGSSPASGSSTLTSGCCDVERSAVNLENQPDLRLLEGEDDGNRTRPEVRERSELIAALVGETGLLQPEEPEDARGRALGPSFSQALRDEGLANALGVARALAEQFHLPLIDLADAGVDSVSSTACTLW